MHCCVFRDVARIYLFGYENTNQVVLGKVHPLVDEFGYVGKERGVGVRSLGGGSGSVATDGSCLGEVWKVC